MAPNVIYCICNMQYDAQNAKYINISAALQSPFKFLLCAGDYGNIILVPKVKNSGYYELLI
jgi:hypothetical protein